MSLLLVDWLGRGGIAQCTWAWAVAVRDAGTDVTIVTRPGREVEPAPGIAVCTAGTAPNPVVAHLQLVREAARLIDRLQPTTVVVQNFVLAPFEGSVSRVARRAGAKVVQVVHDHRLHTRVAGTSLGLAGSVRRADVVVAHTDFVAARVAAIYGRGDVRVVPHPMQVGMFDPVVAPPDPPGPLQTAIHFGVLHRSYKGTATFEELAGRGVPGWRFHAVGAGAAPGPGVEATEGFVDAAVLVAAVDQASAALLPYSIASQSGAVVLAQSRRTVPISTRVGGIPDQIDDGVDGLLLEPGAPVEEWVARLEQLGDRAEWRRLADAGRARARAGHERFVVEVAAHR
jgi:glycosyltransferase involved in cell wall biosynthesis